MHLDDFPNLKAAAKRNDRVDRCEKAIERLQDAIDGSPIYTTEYDSIKNALGDVVRAAFETKVSDPFFWAGRYLEQPKEINEFSWEVHPSNLHDIVSCSNKLNKTKLSGPVIDAMREVVFEALPLATAMKELKAKVLKGRVPSNEPKKPENPNKIVRTCPCCFRGIAVQGNYMAHHGYQRPGYGVQTASCMGVRYKPLERSNEGLVAIVGIYKRELDKLENSLAQRDTITKITTKNHRKKTEVVVTRGEDTWPRTHAAWVYELESGIRITKRQLDELETRLASWVQTEPDPSAPQIETEEEPPLGPRM